MAATPDVRLSTYQAGFYQGGDRGYLTYPTYQHAG
jgi:hypothetical protein